MFFAFVSKAYDRFDVLLLGLLATPAAAGQYEVAYKLAILSMFISGLSNAGLLAKVSDYHSRDKDVSEDIRNTLAFSSLLSVPVFFGALVIAETTVVTTIGREYKSAASLLIGLALYRVVSSQTGVLGSILNVLDKPDLELKTSIVVLVVNIPLGALFYFEIGTLGVVVATVVS